MPRVPAHDAELAALIAAGDRRALARALTLAENDDPSIQAVLGPHRSALGRARRIGITGPPGVGKSTLVAALVQEARGRKLSVAVLAVDPTSPFTGGALLGDRIRMADHTLDEGVFIRSQASRGAGGGLADTTADLLDLLALGGFDVVLVETVGVGQAGLDGVRATDFAVVVLSPQAGDIVQAMKAGLIEAADLVAVNKSDLGGADVVRNDLLAALELSSRGTKEVVICSAQTHDGVAAILDAVLRIPDSELEARRRAKLRDRLEVAVSRRLAGLRKSAGASRAFEAELAKLGQAGESFHDAVQRIVKAAVAAANEARP